MCFKCKNLVAIFSCQSLILGTNIPNDSFYSDTALNNIKHKHTSTILTDLAFLASPKWE